MLVQHNVQAMSTEDQREGKMISVPQPALPNAPQSTSEVTEVAEVTPHNGGGGGDNGGGAGGSGGGNGGGGDNGGGAGGSNGGSGGSNGGGSSSDGAGNGDARDTLLRLKVLNKINEADLSDEQKAEFMQSILGPGAPGQQISDQIWLLIVTSFCIVLVGSFLTIAFILSWWGATPETNLGGPLLTVFTTAAGFLAGLLSPSPIRRDSEGTTTTVRTPPPTTEVETKT